MMSSCRKKETAEVDNENQSAIDNAVADQEYYAIVPTVNNFAVNTKGTGASGYKGAGLAAPCDTLTKISGDTLWGFPGHQSDAVYKLDLGSICQNGFTDGKIRSGEWLIRFTGKLKNANSQMIIKLNNHKANGINYKCDSMVVTVLAFDPLFVKYKVELVKGVCSNPNWNITYKSTRFYTHYPKGNPIGTEPYSEVYGDAEGTNRVGRTFTVKIDQASPLTKYKGCQFIQKGIMELKPNGYNTRTIDFGYAIDPNPKGGCDDDATFTVNGNTVAFKLK